MRKKMISKENFTRVYPYIQGKGPPSSVTSQKEKVNYFQTIIFNDTSQTFNNFQIINMFGS